MAQTTAALGNVNVAPGGVTTSPITTDLELLGSTIGWTQDGVTLATGQGVLAVGTPLVRYEDGTAGPAGSSQNREVADSATFASTGNLVTTDKDHGLVVGDQVSFANVQGSPGVTSGTEYFVKSTPASNTLTLSATNGGSVVTISANGTSGAVTQAETVGTALIGFLRRQVDTGTAGDIPMFGNVVYKGILQYAKIKAANGGADLTNTQLQSLNARLDTARGFLII